MKCLKCGRETDQTFCESCRETMAKYPVKPGTIIQLPKDRSASYARHNQNWRPIISPEIRMEKQRRIIRRLSITVVVLLLLLIAACTTLLWALRGSTQPPVGQNYSAVTKSTEDPTQPTTGPETSGETKGAVG